METIYLGFSFLKQRLEISIVTLIGVIVLNIGIITIYEALSINKCILNKK